MCYIGDMPRSFDSCLSSRISRRENENNLESNHINRRKTDGWFSAAKLLKIFFQIKIFHLLIKQIVSWRNKLIHSLGVIAKAKMEIFPNALTEKYTGIFKTGCDNLLLRPSLAKELMKQKQLQSKLC